MAKAYPEEDVVVSSSHREGDMKDDEFFQRLRSFPCLFTDLIHADGMSPESLEALKKRLLAIKRTMRTSKATTIPTSSDPDNASGGSNFDSILVYILWRLQQEEEAKRTAEEALGTYPKSILVRTNMAYILRKLGDVPAAEEQLRALEEMNSAADFSDLVTEAHLGVAFFYYLNRRFTFGSHAIELYEKILEEQPDNDTCKLYLVRVLKRQRSEGVKIKERDGCDQPDEATTTGRMTTKVTTSLCSQSPLARAMDMLTAIKNKVENNAQLRAEAAAELGGILYYYCTKDVVKEKSTQLGLEPGQCFTQALDLAGDNGTVLLNSGKYFGRAGETEKAVGLFERLVKLQPDDANAHLQLGRTLIATIRKNQQTQWTARHPWDRQSSNTPSRSDSRPRQTHPTSGRYVNTSGAAPTPTQSSVSVQRAMECLQKAQELGEDSTFLVYELGRVHLSLGNTTKRCSTFCR